MNLHIETLNQWGGRWLEFAWPMLWQSSLLIAVVWALDWALARRLRASVRHALWLVVLVKLLLPPTLALPTGVAWWLTPTKAAVKVPEHYAVTYSDAVMPMDFTTPTVRMPAPPVRLNGAGWALTVSMAMSVALLGWLMYRWVQVAGMVRRATGAGGLDEALAAARRLTGLRARVRLKLVEGRLSPAVCGLFRPVILLPRALAERLSEAQLRAVLLHELIHLRRADIWVNCAQALLQILYWWHPLVWLANGRMRRVREEAVDDAVMLALNAEADLYAPTLLEVAKLALHRPMLSLGLVGIMESRSALRQRIERLMEFRAPRKAGLTVISVLGILTFSAVALPMGGAPGPADAPADAVVNPVAAEMVLKTNTPQVLITANLYEVSPADFQKYFADLPFKIFSREKELIWASSSTGINLLKENLKSGGLRPAVSPRIVTTSGIPASLDVGNGTNGFSLECTPVVVDGALQVEIECMNLESSGQGTVTTNRFTAHLRLRNNGGVVLMPVSWFNPARTNVNSHVLVMGVKIITNAPTIGNGNPHAMSAGQQSAVDMGGKSANASTGEIQLLDRTYRTDPDLFPAAIRGMIQDPLKTASPNQAGVNDPGTNVTSEIRRLCELNGIDLKSPPGKFVYYVDKQGLLTVTATQSDLERLQKVLPLLMEEKQLDHSNQMNQPMPLIHFKARFFEVPKGTLAGFSQFVNESNSADGGFTGILTPDNTKAAMKVLESRKGVKVLAMPEGETASGTQVRMMAGEVLTLLTNFTYEMVITNNSHVNNIIAATSKMEFGEKFDATTTVLADDHTIAVNAKAAFAEFFGYAKPPKKMATQWVTNAFGEKLELAVIMPAAQESREAAQVKLYDGQTMVLALGPPEQVRFAEPNKDREAAVAKHIKDAEKKQGEKEVVVFVTATIVDPAGNRVHNDYYDAPFRQSGGGQQY